MAILVLHYVYLLIYLGEGKEQIEEKKIPILNFYLQSRFSPFGHRLSFLADLTPKNSISQPGFFQPSHVTVRPGQNNLYAKRNDKTKITKWNGIGKTHGSNVCNIFLYCNNAQFSCHLLLIEFNFLNWSFFQFLA